MNTIISKTLALGGLCALLAGAGATAFAQGNYHPNRDRQDGQYQRSGDRLADSPRSDYRRSDYHQSDQYRRANQAERRRLDRLHAAYARAAQHGNYGAAERAHRHAQAIRAQHQDRRDQFHGDQGRDRDRRDAR